MSDQISNAHRKCEQLMSALIEHAVPGVSESQLKKKYEELLVQFGGDRTWHAPQIRFGHNTLLPFGRKAEEDKILQEKDIFFIDIGPVFNGVESDFAITQSTDPDQKDIVLKARELWHQVRKSWVALRCDGVCLYKIAFELAFEFGFHLDLTEGGHKIGPFPHNREAPSDLKHCQTPIADAQWILEIKLIDPNKKIGAFFEAPLLLDETVITSHYTFLAKVSE